METVAYSKEHKHSPAIEQLVAVAQTLPPERLAEVLDFALFVQERMEQSEDDARWDALLASPEGQAMLEQLADEAKADIEAGRTLPMFDGQGRWLLDDYTEEDFEKAARAHRSAASPE